MQKTKRFQYNEIFHFFREILRDPKVRDFPYISLTGWSGRYATMEFRLLVSDRGHFHIA